MADNLYTVTITQDWYLFECLEGLDVEFPYTITGSRDFIAGFLCSAWVGEDLTPGLTITSPSGENVDFMDLVEIYYDSCMEESSYHNFAENNIQPIRWDRIDNSSSGFFIIVDFYEKYYKGVTDDWKKGLAAFMVFTENQWVDVMMVKS